MPKTLLAVDDSATMRKVFEITFSGEDYRVITADTGARALGQLGENPNVVVIDTSLAEDAYALAKDVRSRAPSATVILLASRYNPYDANRGRDAGADDFIDKPFDTQQILDKVKKATLARESGAVAAPQPATPAPSPAAAQAPQKGTLPGGAPAIPSSTVPSIQSPFQQPRPPAPAPAPTINTATTTPAPPIAAVKPSPSGSRSHTLSFENSPYATQPKPAAAAPPPPPPPPPPPAPPPPAPVAAAAPAPVVAAPVAAAAPTPIASAVNGQLSGKLGDLGLTPAQADAVLALSREVVERIVWEVVPQLAEAIIKEEIARLTRD